MSKASDLRKAYLLESIEFMNEEQIKLLSDLIDFAIHRRSKGKLMDIVYDRESSNKVDSAFPINYYRRIEDIYPNIDKANLVYDYNRLSLGELVNINDSLLEKLLTVFKP